ncbi:hypothetical protein K458DRAFT_408938 [Lentithecium fluviatile CBS 122367]|uniref:MYND-type domain-containing protein n=1 Tax=Lentithecium fluviatile CBS 122367 TaxID=1168545 RepID=A0A6G1IJN2_9PLEO|nr:hypothetical protein K458DRAFT_408938 [Lentithecium fluviatile CBS 122367]
MDEYHGSGHPLRPLPKQEQVRRFTDSEGNIPLHCAARRPFVEVLIKHDANVRVRKIEGESPLYAACEAVCLLVAEFLVPQSTDIEDFTADVGWTPLVTTAGIAQNLLYQRLRRSSTASEAACVPWGQLVAYLIAQGAHVDATTLNGDTPSHLTCSPHPRVNSEAFIQISDLLIDHGAHLESEDKSGATSLFCILQRVSCDFYDLEMVNILITKGADKNAKNNDGKTAMDGRAPNWEGLNSSDVGQLRPKSRMLLASILTHDNTTGVIGGSCLGALECSCLTAVLTTYAPQQKPPRGLTHHLFYSILPAFASIIPSSYTDIKHYFSTDQNIMPSISDWGRGILMSYREMEINKELDEALGVPELRVKVNARKTAKDKTPGNNFSINADHCNGPESVETVRKYLDTGVLKNYVKGFKGKVHDWDAEDAYRFVVLSACVMTLGCKLWKGMRQRLGEITDPNFREHVRHCYPTSSLAKMKPRARRQFESAVKSYKNGTPYKYGNPSLSEVMAQNFYRAKSVKTIVISGFRVCEVTHRNGERERLPGLPSDEEMGYEPIHPYHLCGGCGREETEDAKLQLCVRCRDRRYCSKDCQAKNWKKHKYLCRALPWEAMEELMESIPPIQVKDDVAEVAQVFEKMGLGSVVALWQMPAWTRTRARATERRYLDHRADESSSAEPWREYECSRRCPCCRSREAQGEHAEEIERVKREHEKEMESNEVKKLKTGLSTLNASTRENDAGSAKDKTAAEKLSEPEPSPARMIAVKMKPVVIVDELKVEFARRARNDEVTDDTLDRMASVLRRGAKDDPAFLGDRRDELQAATEAINARKCRASSHRDCVKIREREIDVIDHEHGDLENGEDVIKAFVDTSEAGRSALKTSNAQTAQYFIDGLYALARDASIGACDMGSRSAGMF